jgi:hypothetical protein
VCMFGDTVGVAGRESRASVAIPHPISISSAGDYLIFHLDAPGPHALPAGFAYRRESGESATARKALGTPRSFARPGAGRAADPHIPTPPTYRYRVATYHGHVRRSWHGRWTYPRAPTHTSHAAHPGGRRSRVSALESPRRPAAAPGCDVTVHGRVVGDEAFAFGRLPLPHTIQTRGEACSNNVTCLEFTHTYTHLSTTLGSARGRRLSRGPRAAIVICTCVASGSHPCHDVSDTSFLHDFVFHTHRLPIARHAIVNVSARARSATRCPWLQVPTLVPYRCPDSLHR